MRTIYHVGGAAFVGRGHARLLPEWEVYFLDFEFFWSQIAIAALLERCEVLGGRLGIYGYNNYVRR
jgi:hypothetical protein